ncbi:hypothetical protein NQD34_017613 [Periophthalmus magnuspinnatus]|nr:hypothetical protein NQD34_017613 [Periophthalmus magnuspinnatus]
MQRTRGSGQLREDFHFNMCFPEEAAAGGAPPPVYAPPPSAHDPNIVGDSAPPEGSSVRTDRGISSTSEEKPTVTEREGGHRPDMNPIINSTSSPGMPLISNALAAYTYVSDHPERAALFFVIGICLGLFLTLFALVLQISCGTDCPP